MSKSIRDIPKKRGRPKTTGRGEGVLLRLHKQLLATLDDWISRQDDRPSRPEAIRRLVEQALASAPAKRLTSSATARKAADLAAREIDQLSDETATGEERASRKRRLIAGPKEFRGIRRK
jgi:Arc/MetJ-type ribon-helix-helix transcriptional regulator